MALPREARYVEGVRPAFFPFAVAATAILAVNSLLLYLRVWPAGHLIIPVAALVLLAVAVVLGYLPSYPCHQGDSEGVGLWHAESTRGPQPSDRQLKSADPAEVWVHAPPPLAGAAARGRCLRLWTTTGAPEERPIVLAWAPHGAEEKGNPRGRCPAEGFQALSKARQLLLPHLPPRVPKHLRVS